MNETSANELRTTTTKLLTQRETIMANVTYHCILLGSEGCLVFKGKTTRELEATYPKNEGIIEIDEKQAKLILNDGKEPLRYVAERILENKKGYKLFELQQKSARSKSPEIDYNSI